MKKRNVSFVLEQNELVVISYRLDTIDPFI